MFVCEPMKPDALFIKTKHSYIVAYHFTLSIIKYSENKKHFVFRFIVCILVSTSKKNSTIAFLVLCTLFSSRPNIPCYLTTTRVELETQSNLFLFCKHYLKTRRRLHEILVFHNQHQVTLQWTKGLKVALRSSLLPIIIKFD